jgi:hypothetical protein
MGLDPEKYRVSTDMNESRVGKAFCSKEANRLLFSVVGI